MDCAERTRRLAAILSQCFISWTEGYSPINDIYTHVDTSSILAVRIFCEMPGTYFAYQNPLFSSLTPNPHPIRGAAVFPQWTISHVPSSVLAPERFTALALYVSVRFYRRPFLCFHARSRARARSKFPSNGGYKKRKKKKKNRSSQQREQRQPRARGFRLSYSSFNLLPRVTHM